MSDFETYQSPFSWRYGSPKMRCIWSERNKRLIWRQLWVALAEVQSAWGLTTPAQAADLRKHAGEVDMARSLEIEKSIRHDLMAELKVFAAQCPIGGGIIHFGATSMDIKDNAEALQIRQSLDIVLSKLYQLLTEAAGQIDETADLPCMAFTHLQPAEPTTLGYRLSSFAQDLLEDWQALRQFRQNLRGKGFKGAVGTAASYVELFGQDGFERFEQQMSAAIDLPFYPAATQTYPRKQDLALLNTLAGLGATLYKFAFDLRILQSQVIGELAEPFGEHQVGSSAMPFKRNPIELEKIDSLARALSLAPQLAWQNSAHSLLERTLDDSANRRTMLPEAFLAVDEIIETATKIISGLQINVTAMQSTLARYAPFSGIERLLMALTKAGADRQEMHARLREHSLAAWQALNRGEANPLVDLLVRDQTIHQYLEPEAIQTLLKIEDYLGIAPQRARQIAAQIRDALSTA
jgi:adenylosuccinate lyase